MKINRHEKLVLYTLKWIDKCINLNLLPGDCLSHEGQAIKVKFNKRKVEKALKNFNPSNEEMLVMFFLMVDEGIVNESACNNFIENCYPSFLDRN
tara:strand:+ start:115 stop:399 length:285 start_codon:yes stop_codon:yes gene_type:complete